MIKYSDFVREEPLICNEMERNAAKKERRRRHAFEKASRLQKHDLSQYATRDEAEVALKAEADEMVVGCGGIFFTVMMAVLSWMIRKLLDRQFGDNK